MPVYKDKKRKTWFVKFRQKNWQGEVKWVTKYGFATKREAANWEEEFKLQKSGSLDMPFQAFVQTYQDDIYPRLKSSTVDNKTNIINTKIVPYFGKKPVRDFTTTDVLKWQNEMLKWSDPETGKPFSKSYLKTIHNQLSAILNHAVRFYGLKVNPASQVGNMGSEKGITMSFWTKEEYLKFSDAMMEDPLAYYCFQVLYWCGIREGELLALTLDDVDLKQKIIHINKTFHRKGGEDILTSPKTEKSRRDVRIPDFLCDQLREYISMCYELTPTERLFPVTKNYLYRMMKKGATKAGVKKIRVHDLRHSHVSLLISMGFSAVAIAERVGHESIDITYRYAHLFPTVQDEMADRLNQEMG